MKGRLGRQVARMKDTDHLAAQPGWDEASCPATHGATLRSGCQSTIKICLPNRCKGGRRRDTDHLAPSQVGEWLPALWITGLLYGEIDKKKIGLFFPYHRTKERFFP